MKKRFINLLLDADISGGGKGVCMALTISNAFTNLSGLALPCSLNSKDDWKKVT